MSAPQLSAAFFVQMFFILIVCRSVGWAAYRYLGQPQVVGEMIAGILLGPSLLGLFFPEWQHLLFPKESLKTLYVGAQLGVGLYMFLVGLEFRHDLFGARVGSAASVSIAGILVPFALAVFLAPPLLEIPGLYSENASLFEAILFLGAAISITAYPMLARLIYEHGLTGTRLGALALSAGAIDDAAAWCVLAIVLASFGEGAAAAILAISAGIAYAILVLTVGRRMLVRLGSAVEREGKVSNAMFATVLTILMLAAWITDAAGIHVVFGGFLLGVAMPRGLLAQELKQKLEPFAVVFLLPMFFTFSGLNTELNVMVNSPALLLAAIMLLAASVLGKGVACWAAARIAGEKNNTALAIGALMNARGLMELIIANIGLQKGVIQPALFSMLVMVAIVTTLMASPIFRRVYGQEREDQDPAEIPLRD